MKRMYVTEDKTRQQWVVRLGRALGRHFIGRYHTQDKAVRARNVAIRDRGFSKMPD